MKNKSLSSYFHLHRRYYRSVNLERDIDKPDAVQGYIPTERSADTLRRVLSAVEDVDRHRAWTMTGVYGTGKSAFAQYLTALCAPQRSKISKEAVEIARRSFGDESPELAAIQESLPNKGLLRAVATGRREPVSWTIIRALFNGLERFRGSDNKAGTPDVLLDLTDWSVEVEEGKANLSNQQVLQALQAVVETTQSSVLLVIDELGKNLEFASHHQGTEDLYLLQQIAELQLKGKHQIYFLGLLHQSFAGYSERLAAVEQSEWSKVQGRFEDIQFTESPSQMTRLIGQAIDRSDAEPVLNVLDSNASKWFKALRPILTEREISQQVLADTYPLHPISALVLPLLCTRYAQNDRSLFTFLTSDEPYALTSFLNSEVVDGEVLPTLKLHQVYDYFVESMTGLASRINLQRWIEIQGLIQDARDQSSEVLQVLKTIGILNLITTTGVLRATPDVVAWALCDRPDKKSQQHWLSTIKSLQEKGLITYRSQLDELRIWEGSDFNVEAAIYEYLEKERTQLAELLDDIRSQKPLVAQRHYATTGTLRYFDQKYIDSLTNLATLSCSQASFDGLVVYWMDASVPEEVPAQTADGKPLILVSTNQLDLLRVRAREFQALKTIQTKAPELQTDGVARREVKQRLIEAERLLDETLAQAFDWSAGRNDCWVLGEGVVIEHVKAFRATLSNVCDRIYSQGMRLDNELINRRELTSQGAKARRELIEAMLEKSHQERLGLEGYGSEVAMYYSVLSATGVHRQEEDEWGFSFPNEGSGIETIWEAIEDFCFDAKDEQRSLDKLYTLLEEPPYGMKQGVLPLLLAAVLSYHVDDVGVYKDGTFIPVLGPEHFELLVKDPARFSVKSFEMAGLRSQVFKELEAILRAPNAKKPAGVRNATLLVIAKPLFSFVRQLPKYTQATKRTSEVAQRVVRALQTAQEPDELLFVSLPEACGLEPIDASAEASEAIAKTFRKKLVKSLHEIQTAYEILLRDCKQCLHEAFAVRSKEANLREDLRVRASYLSGQCIEPMLKRFVMAAADESADDQRWLEALVMIVSDKPPKSWTDEDLTRFELGLSDLVRRFKNVEALQKDVAARGKGFSAKRITMTEADGQEIHRVVWVDQEKEELIDQLVNQVLNETVLKGDSRLQQAFVAKLNERVLGQQRPDLSNNEILGRSNKKSKKTPGKSVG